MPSRAEVTALVDAAPGRLRTLQATVSHWQDPAEARRAFDLLQAKQGGGQFNVLRVSIAVGTGADRPSEDRSRLVYQAGGRWRHEAGPAALVHLDLSDGRHRWTGPAGGELIERMAEVVEGFGPLGWLLAPGYLLGPYALTDPAEARAAGRPCVRAAAERRVPLDGAGPDLPAHPQSLGVDNTYWFDAEFGFVVRHEASVEGRPSSVTELLDLHIDEPVDPAAFRPPAGATIRSEWEARMAILERAGVDPAGVPEGDIDAANAALLRSHAPASVEDRVAAYVPTGPPPSTSPTAVNTAVIAAVGEVDGGGADLVNVQAGEGLAPYMEQAARRLPRATRENTTWVVDAVRFLGPDHAVVFFTVLAGGQPTPISQRPGRAIRRGGRWLVEHATVVELLAMAGVRVPPPGDR